MRKQGTKANLSGHEGGNAGHGQGAPKEPSGSGKPSTEGAEGRRQAEGNVQPRTMYRTQSREDMHSARERIRRVAKTDKGRRFTALLHHVYDITALREAYFGLKRDAAPGVDGETWRAYGEQLEERLEDLCGRLQRGASGDPEL